MNIGERLEALTHNVELLAGMQIESEKRITRLTERVAQLVDRSDLLQQHMATLADGMAQLTRIALDHEERISRLQGNQPGQ